MLVEDFLNKKIAVVFRPCDIDKLTEFQDFVGEARFVSGIRVDSEIIVNALKKNNNILIIYVSLDLKHQQGVMYCTDTESYLVRRGYKIIPVDEFLNWHDLADISEDEIRSLFN